MKTLLLLLVLQTICFAQTSKDLIGSWQAAPHVAAGYDDTYTFNEDGTFYYFSNQMDCSKRETGYGGFWELEGKTIQLTVTFYDIEKGGKLVPSDGSCGSDSMLVGSSNMKIYVSPYILIALKLGTYKPEIEDGNERYTMEINNRKHWHFSKFEY
ncbi:MAG TPA: lipocalin family protein [Ignavibacteria bacterium]|nr:lipocalin family protein [Ignavibacteria bacterium]